jgi:thymidylate synthase
MTNKPRPGEQYTYGAFLESQIDEVIRRLKSGPGSNQTYMAVGGVLGLGGGLTGPDLFLSDPPCLRGIDVRLLNNRLHFVLYFRSWDLWAGFPANLAAIQILKEYMASEIGCADGEIIASSKGLHLYEYSWELAKYVVER